MRRRTACLRQWPRPDTRDPEALRLCVPVVRAVRLDDRSVCLVPTHPPPPPLAALTPESASPLSFTVHSMPTPALTARRTASRPLKMLLVLLVCAAPVIASYFTYFVIRPEGRTNYSELVTPPRACPLRCRWPTCRAGRCRPPALQGQWLLVVVAGGACDARCETHLWLQRQLRETLGREKDRVDKVWLITDDATPRPELLQAITRRRSRPPCCACPPRHWRSGSSPADGPAARRAPVPGRPDGQLDDARAGRPGPGQAQARPRTAAARLGSLGPGGPLKRPLSPALHDSSHERPAYDLGAGAALVLVGAAARARAAALGLAAPSASRAARRRRALTVLTLFLTFDLVLFGAFTRLTDSGLGCPDWPGCYGSASPLGATASHRRGAERDAHRPGDARQGLDRDDPPLPGHRRRRADHRAGRGELARGAQARSEPVPLVAVVAHRDAGLGLRARRVRRADGDDEAVPGHRHAAPARRAGPAGAAGGAEPGCTAQRPAGAVAPPALRGVAGCGRRSACVQIALGGWVSTNYAVLACSDFPTCQGAGGRRWTSSTASRVLRELGAGKDGGYLPFAALTAIHYRPPARRAVVVLAHRRCWPGACARPATPRCAAGRSALAGASRCGSSPAA